MVTIQPVAWRCIWRKFGKSAWEQYHDETDPLPGKWDCAPNEIIALYDQATVDALRKDAERYRWLRDKALDVAACWERGGQQEPWCVIGTCADDAVPCSDTELDAAIDAAMNGANT